MFYFGFEIEYMGSGWGSYSEKMAAGEEGGTESILEP